VRPAIMPRGTSVFSDEMAIPIGDRTVALVVKRYASAAGLASEKYAGHSLRAGLVTQAAINPGAGNRHHARQTRHKSKKGVQGTATKRFRPIVSSQLVQVPKVPSSMRRNAA
jgi:hypothetical protein